MKGWIVGDATEWAKLRDGLGADCIIDAAGASITLKNAMQWVRPKDTSPKLDGDHSHWDFPLIPSFRRTSHCGKFSHNWPIWERVIALMAGGQSDVKPIIGGVWPVTEWHEAFEKMHSGAVVKVFEPILRQCGSNMNRADYR